MSHFIIDLNFLCSCLQNDRPVVNGTKGIQLAADKKTLMIPAFNNQHVGIYYCNGTNAFGTVQRMFYIKFELGIWK